MNTIEKAQVIYYHRRCMQEETQPVRKLGWLDMESQQKRFKVLCDMVDLNDQVIMDVGCGFGDLKSYMDTRFGSFIYLGIDHQPEFITQAKRRFKRTRNTFFKQADFTVDGLPEVDYVFVSGAFSYQTDNLLFLNRIIEKMYASARKGVAFNLLDEEGFVGNTVLQAYNRYEVLSFCLRLANRAALVTGYLDDDFTIMMYK